MIPHGDHFVPFAAGSYQELRYVDGRWLLTTLDNLEYTFAPAATIAPGDGMDDPDLWLLSRVRDRAGRDEVELEYAVDGVGTCGKELRLTAVRYTFDHDGGHHHALYEVRLDYEPWWRPGATGEGCAPDPATASQAWASRWPSTWQRGAASP